MSVEITSIVISIISLTGTILATGVGAYMTYHSEERKVIREVNKILLKYRDPLLLSAQDLQARLYGLCDRDVIDYKEKDVPGEDTYRDTLYIYTAYVVGQYLSWTWILRRQAQFMSLMSSSPPKFRFVSWANKRSGATALMKKIDQIKYVFGGDEYGELERPFILFKAHQTGIGEVMSCQDTKSGEYYCMGFATFTQRWKNGDPALYKNNTTVTHEHEKTGEDMAGVAKIPDREFRKAFHSIEKGIETIWKHRQQSRIDTPDNITNQGSDGRLRRLQHLLLDLTVELDPDGLLNNEHENLRALNVANCLCTKAPCHTVAPPRPSPKSSPQVSGTLTERDATTGAEADVELGQRENGNLEGQRT